MIKRLLTRVFVRISRLFGIPVIQHRLDGAAREIQNLKDSHRDDTRFGLLERHLERRTQQQVADQVTQARQQLNDQTAEIHQQLADQTAEIHQQLSDFGLLLNEAQLSVISTTTRHTEEMINDLRNYLESELIVTKRNLDNLRRVTTFQVPVITDPSELKQAPPAIDDALYVSLEDHFRGDKETVRQRQLEYLPFISDTVSDKHPLIDLGCGRGEWLAILRENHIPASGIDSNIACVSECKENGLSVSLGDLLDALRQLPDASFGAITLFQVLEHLPFEKVVEVLRESRRALIPGGVFIGEVPNSETLRVGASTFWIDPTHQRPIFPAVLAFLAKTVGFSDVAGKYSSPLAPPPELAGLPDNARKAIFELHQAVNGPGDFALIANA